MFFDAFDSIRILNLPHRADRRREMRHELKRLGIADDRRVSFFEASRAEGMGGFSSKNVHGCFASHLRLLEEAAKARERVLVLEDDCDFAPAARIYELPPEWDIFYGGYLADTPDDLDNSNMIGAHCMGYSPRAVKRLAAYLRDLLEDPNFTPDPIAAADSDFDPRIKPPFDGAIVWFRRANVDLKTIFAQIAVQRSSRSDIADGSFLDRTLPSAAAVARKVKNRLRRWR